MFDIMDDKINIVISGLGGVGGYYGSKLAYRYKNDENIRIYFIARGEHGMKIKDEGIKVISVDEEFSAKPYGISDKAEDLGVIAHYIICCTKEYDLEENILSMQSIMDKETVIVPMQNGANISERIRKILPNNEVLSGLTYVIAKIIDLGTIENILDNPKIIFGNPNGKSPKVDSLLKIMKDANINAIVPEDINREVWKKYVLISASATSTSYFNIPTRRVIDEKRESFRKLLYEVINIAKAKGVNIDYSWGENIVENYWKDDVNSTTSMHRDFLKGHGRVELESLCGYVIKEGLKLGVPTPTYDLMYKKLLFLKSQFNTTL